MADILTDLLRLIGVPVDSAESALSSLLNSVKSFLGGFFDRETRFLTAIFSIQDTVTRAKQQLQDFSHFKPEVNKFQTRVILAPRAIANLIDLKNTVVNIFTEKLTNIETEVKTFLSSLQPQQAPSGGAEEDAGSVANTVVKIDAWIETLNRLSDLLKDLLDFTQAIDDVKQRIEHLDDIFLPQGNSRKWVTEKTYKRVK